MDLEKGFEKTAAGGWGRACHSPAPEPRPQLVPSVSNQKGVCRCCGLMLSFIHLLSLKELPSSMRECVNLRK